MTSSLFLADEDAVLRDCLQQLLASESDLSVLGAESVPGKVRAAIEGEAVDLVILSSELEDGSFLPLCQEFAGRMTVLVLAKHDFERTLMRSLQAGAIGVVTTDADFVEWLHTVRAALQGEACVPRGMLGGLLHELIERRRHDDAVQQRFNKLTTREREVLHLLSAGNDVDGVASTMFISPQTVRSHVQRVLDKLEVHSRAEAVALALDHDLFEGSPSHGGRL